MRLHSLKHEKRKKIILNSKWRQKPRWMPKCVCNIAFTQFHIFQNAFLRSFYFALLNFFRNKLFSKIQNCTRIHDGCLNMFSSMCLQNFIFLKTPLSFFFILLLLNFHRNNFFYDFFGFHWLICCLNVFYDFERTAIKISYFILLLRY
jgi:hypothetical protein